MNCHNELAEYSDDTQWIEFSDNRAIFDCRLYRSIKYTVATLYESYRQLFELHHLKDLEIVMKLKEEQHC